MLPVPDQAANLHVCLSYQNLMNLGRFIIICTLFIIHAVYCLLTPCRRHEDILSQKYTYYNNIMYTQCCTVTVFNS